MKRIYSDHFIYIMQCVLKDKMQQKFRSPMKTNDYKTKTERTF